MSNQILREEKQMHAFLEDYCAALAAKLTNSDQPSHTFPHGFFTDICRSLAADEISDDFPDWSDFE